MLDQAAVGRLSAALVSRAGGYLRNPPREERVTCAVCAAPAAGYARCYTCGHRDQDGLADAVGVLAYAVGGRQSGYVLRGYKAPKPLEEHRAIVVLLLLSGLVRHGSCAGRVAGAGVTHWATVPSLPAKAGEHPLHVIVRNLASRFGAGVVPGREAVIGAAGKVAFPRDVDPGHFVVREGLPGGSHVLLIDDTWVGGGHAQSAVLALRAAGAGRVSVLVIGRWLNADFGETAIFLDERVTRDYDPAICPWTGGGCPAGACSEPPPAAG